MMSETTRMNSTEETQRILRIVVAVLEDHTWDSSPHDIAVTLGQRLQAAGVGGMNRHPTLVAINLWDAAQRIEHAEQRVQPGRSVDDVRNGGLYDLVRLCRYELVRVEVKEAAA